MCSLYNKLLSESTTLEMQHTTTALQRTKEWIMTEQQVTAWRYWEKENDTAMQ